MIEVAIGDKLGEDATIQALVLGGVHQLMVPQHEKRLALRVQLIDETHDYFQRGREAVTTARVQIDAFAHESAVDDPYDAILQASMAIDDCFGLAGFEVGSPPVQVLFVRREDRRPFEPDEFGNYRMLNDYMLRFRVS